MTFDSSSVAKGSYIFRGISEMQVGGCEVGCEINNIPCPLFFEILANSILINGELFSAIAI